MFKEKRKSLILQYIQDQHYAKSQDLSEKFEISLMTVSRLLRELHNEGKVHKFHGGAASMEYIKTQPHEEGTFEEKRKDKLKKKHCIASYAVEHFIEPNKTYFFESGSTINEMTYFLQDDSISIISNGIHFVSNIMKQLPTANVICICGSTRHRSLSIVGKYATQFLDNFSADALFISAQAVSPQGIMDPDPLETSVKQKMIERSKKVVLLADMSKINTVSTELVAGFDLIDDIITDKPISKYMLDFLSRSNVNIHIVECNESTEEGCSDEESKES